ncbi:MAG TPA: restriction endonuclease subunit S [Rickettsia endosymbiont of Bembidion lapponicum]|nr:restriction endonuclease subunit S [Rickettsia endosymbiont of Bembidion lapponicum]
MNLKKIPNNWHKNTFKEIALIERGKFSIRPRNDPRYYGGTIPFIQTGDISKSSSHIKNYKQTLNEKGLKVSKLFPKGTIVLTIAANIGSIGILTFDSAFPDSIVGITPKNNINSFWLFWALKNMKGIFEKLATKNAQKNLNLEKLQSISVNVPPLPEQQKIANILRVWDKDIEILTKLCDAKRKSYNVIARNIFDNQAKKEKWQAVKLSTISTIKKGKQLNRLDMKGGIYPVWNGGIIPSGFTDQWNMEANTITISEGGSCGFVNLCKEKFWLGGHCYSVTNLAANLNKCFLFFQLKQNEPRIMRLKTGSGLPNIQKPSIENYVVYIPSLEQQTKIANYLNSLCDEIEIYKKELELIKKQKQGLIQKLLTGEWRVKIDE